MRENSTKNDRDDNSLPSILPGTNNFGNPNLTYGQKVNKKDTGGGNKDNFENLFAFPEQEIIKMRKAKMIEHTEKYLKQQIQIDQEPPQKPPQKTNSGQTKASPSSFEPNEPHKPAYRPDEVQYKPEPNFFTKPPELNFQENIDNRIQTRSLAGDKQNYFQSNRFRQDSIVLLGED